MTKQAWFSVAPLVVAALALSACAQTAPLKDSAYEASEIGSSEVVLMPPDVEVVELTAAGMREPRADWTETATKNVRQALRNELAERGARMISYRPANDPVQVVRDEHQQLVKLHGAVGNTILVHGYLPAYSLPTKPEDRLAWTLGDGVARLRKDYDADYALFVHYRDAFSTPGRVALIATAALFGVSVPGGQQVGFASLVDLESGDVAWFTRLHSGFGDLRDPELARRSVDALLDEAPL
jgi:hypothetical protein